MASDQLDDYLGALWSERPLDADEILVAILAELSEDLADEQHTPLFRRILSVYIRCFQRKGVPKSLDELVDELRVRGSVELHGESIRLPQLAHLVVALMFGEFALDSLILGPQDDARAQWSEIERLSGWGRSALIDLSTCYRMQRSQFLVDRLRFEEPD